ncbi:MAG: CRTAC1 family protein [Acidobacteriota bacterium]
MTRGLPGRGLGLVGLLVLATSTTGALAEPAFVERSEALGLTANHRYFPTGDKAMPENMGPGLAVLDVDADDRLDVVMMQGAPVAFGEAATADTPAGTGHQLWRQQADGTFADATADAGLGAGVGMGVCFGDVDRDGDLDLFLTHYGADRLLINRGDGTFTERSHGAAAEDRRWSTGCTFFDPDGDGDLDLYVSRYVDWSSTNDKFCGNAAKKLRSYCHPDVYAAAPDAFYRNDGRGRFVDATRDAGIRPTPDGKGLGVLASDFDADGRIDVFVANDSTANSLWLGDGKGRFAESALLAGLALNGAGAAEAGMGVAWGDLDGDGRGELLLTHLDRETNTLYRPIADGLYADATEASGLGAPSLPWVGFGVAVFDADLDADLDLAVVNGHILDNIARFDPSRSHRQPAQWLRNDGRGRFAEVPDGLGDELLVGRGLVAADLDRDGDLDLLATQNGDPLRVWTNRVADGRSSLTVRLEGRQSNSHGYGARLVLGSGKGETAEVQVREMLAASSYLSQGPPEIVFAWPATGPRTLHVEWPSGTVDRVTVDRSGRIEVVEGSTEHD